MKEKDKYEKMKENFRSENEEYKLWDWVVSYDIKVIYYWVFYVIKKFFFPGMI